MGLYLERRSIKGCGSQSAENNAPPFRMKVTIQPTFLMRGIRNYSPRGLSGF